MRSFCRFINKTVLVVATIGIAATAYSQQEFTSPTQAASLLVKAVESGEESQLLDLFGAKAKDILNSGDAVADKQDFQDFGHRVKALTAVSPLSETTAILVIGEEGWPFPIPLVKSGDKWKFDLVSGRETVINRRVGRNEIETINALKQIAKAQEDYRQFDYDDDGVLEYAQKIISTDKQTDGLYWDEQENGFVSPLDSLIAEAAIDGYTSNNSPTSPFHGYYFKILTAQGENAHGGAYSYIINGNMIAGYAVLAWPVKYGESGIKTFAVDSAGNIWSADLGQIDRSGENAIETFNPEKDWVFEK